MLRKVLLTCGIAAAAFYVALDAFAALRYPGYSPFEHTVSELFAVGAPARPLFITIGLIYPVLWFAFGAGIWMSAGRAIALKLVAAGLIGKEILGTVVTLFFPMHQRAVLAA